MLALRPTITHARGEGIEIGEGVVLVKVRTKPQDGKANEAVLELLADALGVATSRLQLLRGATGRDKLVPDLLTEQQQYDATLSAVAD